jgi:hypothetical protein
MRAQQSKVKMRSNTWLWILAIAMLAALAWGLEQVAFTPLQTGEVYPPFSSLRADPMGAKALYESLAALPGGSHSGIQVDRLYKQRQKLESPRDAMFVLGVDPAAWSRVDSKTLDEYVKLVQDGGRLVIGFLPVRGGRVPREPPKETPAVVLLWHIQLTYRNSESDDNATGIPHKTALYFSPSRSAPEAKWRTITSDPSDQRAETIEKTFGKGTIVLVADTYPLSNEGLREARDAGLIARIAGAATHITFDENHFGVSETGSVTKLMRRYRLQGAVVILIVAAALFLWRSASSLLPPRGAPFESQFKASGALGTSQRAIAGRDSVEGLAALLHRGVPEKQLLDACFAEWSKSISRGAHGSRGARGHNDARMPRAAAAIEDEIARQGARAPVDAYRAACRILTEKT